ncbi:MAG: hypothetical protein AAGI08_01705 [Bacteroidota bacterium]
MNSSSFAKITLGYGSALILLGVLGYVLSGMQSATALIPAFFGLPVTLFGWIAAKREKLRKHLIHGALLFALLGLFGTIGGIADLPALLDGTAERPLAVISRSVMAILTLLYLALGIRSFVAARRSS